MKSYDGKVSINVRKNKYKSTIVLRKTINGRDIKVSTGKPPTPENLEFYREYGDMEFQKLTTPTKIILFKELLIEALPIINAQVSERTAKDRLSKINNHLLPTFGDQNIEHISTKSIELWQTKMIAESGANLTRRCKNLLNRILDRAVAYGYILTNPCTRTLKVLDKNRGKSREIYTKEEITIMLENATGWLKAFLVVRIYLGLRSSETIGLMWKDVDFQNRKVHVRRGIIMGKILPPKTGERTIDLPTAPMEELTKLKEKSESEWVFVSSSGSHWGDCSYINRRHFQPLLKKIGIKYKSFYSLRHCYATYSLVGGQPLPYVSKQLGHKDSRTTLQSYLKYSEDIGGIEKTDKILKF